MKYIEQWLSGLGKLVVLVMCPLYLYIMHVCFIFEHRPGIYCSKTEGKWDNHSKEASSAHTSRYVRSWRGGCRGQKEAVLLDSTPASGNYVNLSVFYCR